MLTEDDLSNRELTWLAKHKSELWTAAQVGYATHGRGAVLVVFEEVRAGEVVIAYTNRTDWPTPVIVAQIAQYNPATEMLIVCLGQLDDPTAQAPPRAYRVQYLTPAA